MSEPKFDERIAIATTMLDRAKRLAEAACLYDSNSFPDRQELTRLALRSIDMASHELGLAHERAGAP